MDTLAISHRSAEKRYERTKAPGLITSLWPGKMEKKMGKTQQSSDKYFSTLLKDVYAYINKNGVNCMDYDCIMFPLINWQHTV